jgi:uncharacterized membrane protein
MTLLALIVAAYAGAALIAPVTRSPFLTDLFTSLPIAISVHLAGGLVAIAIGAFQVNARLRSRFLPAHRWLGRTYVVAVVLGGIAGLVLARESFGGLVTHFGFGLMAICWLGTTLNAYRHIRRGDFVSHRAWMLRSYSLTLAAVTLRIYLPLSQMAGIAFEDSYPAISWLCWVPNLLFVEWFILTRKYELSTAV